jgi:hypothetical protein
MIRTEKDSSHKEYHDVIEKEDACSGIDNLGMPKRRRSKRSAKNRSLDMVT